MSDTTASNTSGVCVCVFQVGQRKAGEFRWGPMCYAQAEETVKKRGDSAWLRKTLPQHIKQNYADVENVTEPSWFKLLIEKKWQKTPVDTGVPIRKHPVFPVMLLCCWFTSRTWQFCPVAGKFGGTLHRTLLSHISSLAVYRVHWQANIFYTCKSILSRV